jgi:hypothetical protein
MNATISTGQAIRYVGTCQFPKAGELGTYDKIPVHDIYCGDVIKMSAAFVDARGIAHYVDDHEIEPVAPRGTNGE